MSRVGSLHTQAALHHHVGYRLRQRHISATICRQQGQCRHRQNAFRTGDWHGSQFCRQALLLIKCSSSATMAASRPVHSLHADRARHAVQLSTQTPQVSTRATLVHLCLAPTSQMMECDLQILPMVATATIPKTIQLQIQQGMLHMQHTYIQVMVKSSCCRSWSNVHIHRDSTCDLQCALMQQCCTSSMEMGELRGCSQSLHCPVGLPGSWPGTGPEACPLCGPALLYWPGLYDHLHWRTQRLDHQSAPADLHQGGTVLAALSATVWV